ncbi:hypothetical protein A8B79_02380 [Balneola sp. EhC07]|nr:hypothetical protein A8B79_02380 [Balneola sp. EhC07]
MIGIGFRFLFGADTVHFIGPTLSTSALGLLFPLLEPKQIELDKKSIPRNTIVTNKRDSNFISFAYVVLIIATITWYTCNHLSFSLESEKLVYSAWLGLSTYFISIILTFIKERI